MGAMVKYMHSGMVGAPQFSRLRGQMIQTLDTCLLSGFNIQTPQSISHADGIMTITYGVAHGYEAGQVLKITGANQPEYNSEFRVDSTPTANTVKCKINTDPVSPATGTFSSKVAPLDWEKPFYNSTKHAYRSKDMTSTRHILLLEDIQRSDYQEGWGVAYRASILSDMIDINNPVINFSANDLPPIAANDGYNWWIQCRSYYEWYGVGDFPRNWTLIGDGKRFFFIPSWHNDYSFQTGCSIYYFGDIKPYYQGDEFRSLLCCTRFNTRTEGYSYGSQGTAFRTVGDWASGGYFPRPLLGTSNTMSTFKPCSIALRSGAYFSGRDTGCPYPNPYTGGMVISPVLAFDGQGLRGEVYGIHSVLSDLYNTLGGVMVYHREIHNIKLNGVDRKFVTIAYGADDRWGFYAFALDDSWE